jgi:transposase
MEAYNENGIIDLRDTRTERSGRPREGELSLEGKIARLEAQINLLKVENKLLKIRFAERGWGSSLSS